ncbi:hypothetical protein GCM10023321_31520 [Pseudonocardia eucalypti]|uniref:HTH tetR-type domain-containing protein n=1 Tax=Pseudonocardia eucalypti TaxID=648755 RepID=A0ABP9Q5U1_9PSEU|nr:DNA-binding transcriptional regulator YbjK [Pseudonocardia eucalypti]
MAVHLRRSNGDTADERIRRGTRLRQELIEATVRIIAREGTAGVTHRAVTAEVNAEPGAVVHHFGSRDVLLQQTLEYLMRRQAALLQPYWSQLERHARNPEAFTDRLCVLASVMVQGDRDVGIATFELQLAASRTPELREVLAERGRAFARLAEKALTELGSTDPRADSARLINAIGGLLAGQLALPRRDFEERILRPVVHRLVTAIARPAA